ncbi:MAG: hypothetical protein A3E80_00110 [Chlamydiae bacterium RIFCSPHIGHO2_12_FULL_49_9]|nr:MAG: hypothetical protein A3E80_00110 [Chlamydiae bacterium RIFCSPHIGHO2_12_FULL_49_9]
MIQKSCAWSVLIYGTFVGLLGLYGYYGGGSIMSLYAGGSSGIFLAVFALAMFANRRYGAYGALLLTFGLTGLFAYRYSVSAAVIPAIMSVFSGAMLLYLLTQVSKWRE